MLSSAFTWLRNYRNYRNSLCYCFALILYKLNVDERKEFWILSQEQFCTSKLYKSLLINGTNIWRLEVVILKSYSKHCLFFIYIVHIRRMIIQRTHQGGNCRVRSKPVGGIFGSPSGGLVPFRTMTSGLIMHSTISFCRRGILSPSLRVRPITRMMTKLRCTPFPVHSKSVFGQQPITRWA